MIRSATFEDVIWVCEHLQDIERREWAALSWEDYDPRACASEVAGYIGPSWAVLDRDSEPVVICGLHLVRPGVMRSWMGGTVSWPRVVLEATKLSRWALASAKQRGVHRIETFSAAFHEQAHRWYRLLELEMEARLAGYGRGGEDFLLFTYRG